MSLNYKKGVPIAYVKGGKQDDSILYLSTDKKGIKEVKIKDGKFEVLIDPDKREIIYIAGPAGVGKSTISRSITDVYHELFPNAPIFLFSKLTDDPAFDDLQESGEIIRVVINEQLIEQPIEVLEEVDPKVGALFIFDDTDTINNKKILERINALKRDIMEVGRHNNIYSLQTSHLINGTSKNDTRYILNELNKMIIFPGSGGYKQQRYVLENYWGMNKKDIEKLLDTDSRWLLISKNYPQYILTENKCYLLR